MNVRVEPPGQFDTFTELFASESLESFLSEWESSIDELDVWSLAKCVADDGFVLFGSDGTGRVDDESSLFRVGGNGIDGAKDKLLLEVREEDEISIGLWIRGLQQSATWNEKRSTVKL